MTAASGTPGRPRSRLIAPLLLAGYLVAAPWIFFLAPLAILLIVSGPRTRREWLVIVLALASGVTLLDEPAGLTDRTVRAAGMFFTGTYVTLALLGNRSLFVRCVSAVTVATAFTAGWFVALRFRFAELRESIVAQQWTAYRSLMRGLPAAPPPASEPVVAGTRLEQFAWDLARTIELMGELYPAVIALSALVGGWLAWVWYHRLASAPMGEPPRLFRHFRFSDHLVWALVLALALTMLRVPPGVQLTAKNLLIVIFGLYAARGVAVVRTVLLEAPPFMTPLLCFLALPLLPLAVTGCVVVGVADTWLDLRRRVPPPEGVSR